MRGLEFLPETPVVLAPMAGFTDLSYRGLCRELGCDFTYTEMVSAKGLMYGGEGSRRLLRRAPNENPFGVQIFGREPEIMADMAAKICDDYPGVGVVDINMGCPAPKITGNGEGSALMKEPLLAGRIIEAVARAVPVPVTVKIRKGWDQNSVNCLEMISIAERSGAAAVALHGRTREQMYSGAADWDIIARAVEIASIPVIGNGDVFSGADAVALRERTGCSGIMVARGALGNPFIFREIKAALEGREYIPPSHRERLDMALRHLDGILEDKGEHGAVEMRKHMASYCRGMRGAAVFRADATRAESPEALRGVIERYRDSLGE